MGLILDSGVLIASERRGEALRDLIRRIQVLYGEGIEVALSTVSIVELTHGISRAQTASHRQRRRAFVDEFCRDLIVCPVTMAIAELAGRIEGEQAARGIRIAFEDLVIGATALHLGFDLATLNVRHCERIPGLTVVTP
jgi:predicted nucleic acid-binding protein